MLIFWVTRPNGDIAKQSKDPTFNPYFYVPKYRSSDALPAPKIFLWFVRIFGNIIWEN